MSVAKGEYRRIHIPRGTLLYIDFVLHLCHVLMRHVFVCVFTSVINNYMSIYLLVRVLLSGLPGGILKITLWIIGTQTR